MEGPDRPSWRREDVSKNLGHTNEDQVARPRNNRKFSQEQRRGEGDEKGLYLKENKKKEGEQDDTKGESYSSETRERTQKSRRGLDSDSHHDRHQKKPTDATAKRRQGPIKPPKPPSEQETGSERPASGQEDPGNDRSSQNPARVEATSKAGRDLGRYTPIQVRGQRQTRSQNRRPVQRIRDKIPESKETQTG